MECASHACAFATPRRAAGLRPGEAWLRREKAGAWLPHSKEQNHQSPGQELKRLPYPWDATMPSAWALCNQRKRMVTILVCGATLSRTCGIAGIRSRDISTSRATGNCAVHGPINHQPDFCNGSLGSVCEGPPAKDPDSSSDLIGFGTFKGCNNAWRSLRRSC